MAIREVLAKRKDKRVVRKEMRAARLGLRRELRALRAYDGGLKAEKDSRELRLAAAVLEARTGLKRAWLSRRGRRIDLPALMSQRKADGSFVWALRDPAKDLGGGGSVPEGTRDFDGEVFVGGGWHLKGLPRPTARLSPVGGIPPLPPKVRRLATDPGVRRRARWVGLLYQPEGWREERPDPALVVEWCDLPGEYYALAVWGPDYRRLMEFVS